MELGPDLSLGHARLHSLTHVGHGRLAGVGGAAHGPDLVGAFDLAGLLHHLLAVGDRDPTPFEGLEPEVAALVDRDTGVGPAVVGDDIEDIGRPPLRDLLVAVARQEVGRADRRAGLGDDVAVARQELTPLVVPHDDIAVAAHEGVAGRVVHDPELHVGRVRHVPDVHRVHHEHPVAAVPLHRLDRSVDAVLAHGRQVGKLEPVGQPFGLQRLARPDGEMVQVAGSARHLGRTVECRLDRASDSSSHRRPPSSASVRRRGPRYTPRPGSPPG